MKTFSAPVLAALASGSVALVTLIELQFATPIYLNSSTWTLMFDGKEYRGAAGLGQINAIADKPGEVAGLNLELSGVSSDVISLALDDAAVVQGTPCVIRTAIIETVDYTVLDAPVAWTGYLDTMSINEDGDKATISVSVESKAVDLLRGNARYYSDADQRALAPADGCFSYVVDQIGQPVVWPTKAFFYQ